LKQLETRDNFFSNILASTVNTQKWSCKIELPDPNNKITYVVQKVLVVVVLKVVPPHAP
jgi:hypothetical protein